MRAEAGEATEREYPPTLDMARAKIKAVELPPRNSDPEEAMKFANLFVVLCAALSIAAGLARAADADEPLYRDASQPIEKLSGRPAGPNDARREGRPDEHALRLRGRPGRDHRTEEGRRRRSSPRASS